MAHLTNSRSHEQLDCDHHNMSNSETNRPPFQRRISHVYPSNNFAHVPIHTFKLRTHHGIYTETLFVVICLCLRSKFVWQSYGKQMVSLAWTPQLHTNTRPQSELRRYWKKSDPTQERRVCLFPRPLSPPLPRRNNQTTHKCSTRNWSLILVRQNRNRGRCDAPSFVW